MPIAAGTKLLLTTENRPLPNCVKTALTAPGCVTVDSTGSMDGGQPPIIARAASGAYYGYSVLAKVGAGEQAMLGNGAVVEGFTGCTQGSEVYMTAGDGSLTHTSAGNGNPIGVALSATKIYFYAR